MYSYLTACNNCGAAENNKIKEIKTMIKHFKCNISIYFNLILWIVIFWMVFSYFDVKLDTIKAWNFYKIFNMI